MPNIDAVKYLVGDIWPKVKKDLPRAKLWIVGHSPTQEVKHLSKSADIKVSSNVKDIRTAYGQAHVLLAPIRSGKGTRYKILEAMATGTPVVTTSLGAEGLQIQNGQHVLIGDNSSQLAKHTLQLLKDSKIQKSLAKSAREFVSRQYNWKRISQDLDRLYRQIGIN